MFTQLIENEYLITNGIGGFSSSSLTGANTRKYHSILNASFNPPVSRHVLLSRVMTTVEINNKVFTLESTVNTDKQIDNTEYTRNFSDMPIPTFEYAIEGITVTKEIAMANGHNTSTVLYTIKTNDKPVTIKAYLHVNSRDHHDLSVKNGFKYDITSLDTSLTLKNDLTPFNIKGFGEYTEVNEWAEEEFFSVEKRRGQEDVDTNFIPGYYEVIIPAHTSVSYGVIASTEEINESSETIIENEKKRRQGLFQDDDLISQRLHIACDHFVVDRKSTNSKTVIAGYPWFTDWGRDTMIALPGLTLTTKRYEDAKDIIRTFIKYEKDGLIPNMFPDDNVEPMYNTIDGTLWLFIAIHHYMKATNDTLFLKEIHPTLNRIIEKHISGTTYDIHVDSDGLLSGGDPTTQLTWMDVKIDGHVVTPRHGKAVEINALWYNSLKIMNQLTCDYSLDSSIDYNTYAKKCLNSFNEKFWNEEGQYLFDLIQDNKPVDRIRPNQIFVVSLPHKMLSIEKEKMVIKTVEEKLLTPVGLRSLSQDHEDYKAVYNGDVYKRDYAYHQGTVWGWLIGPYLEAHFNVYQDKAYVLKHLEGMFKHLDDTGMGTISEVFSGDSPHHARGCFGQAWSVSETLRVYKMVTE